MDNLEGVVKFRLNFSKTSVDKSELDLDNFNHWRSLCLARGWIGQDKGRYEGLAFGNLSVRLGKSSKFMISGTQTGDKNILTIDDLARVDDFVIGKNKVWASGRIKPSSESMTHAVLYELDLAIRAIIHIHAPAIWMKTAELNLPATRAAVAYGTVEMAKEVRNLYKKQQFKAQGIFSMSGHEDGIVAFGSGLKRAAELLLEISP